MNPSDVISAALFFFFVVPLVAAFVSFSGSTEARSISRYILVVASIAYAIAVLACLRMAFGPSKGGIGNGVFLLIAIPVAIFGTIWFGVWRAVVRHAYVQSLAPDLLAVEEREDVDRAIEALRKSLAAAERRARKWTLSSEEAADLRFQIRLMRKTLEEAEQMRAAMGSKG